MKEEQYSDKKETGRRLFEIVDKSSLPRERARREGIRVLSDSEIMAILLRTGTQGKNVLDLAQEILRSTDGHLSRLFYMTPQEVMKKFSGIGEGKALSLLAALELGRRAAHDLAQVELSRKALKTSSDCYQLMRNRLQDLPHEEFWVLMLNNSLKPIKEICVNKGATNFTVVEIKNIVKPMIDAGANHAVLFHNHPSGSLNPSGQDDAITRKITEALRLFDFKVIDHIIITPSSYYSYADNGRL